MTDRRCCAEPPRQNTAALARKRDYDRILVIGSSDVSEGPSRGRRGRATSRFASIALPECSLPRFARGPAQHPADARIQTVSTRRDLASRYSFPLCFSFHHHLRLCSRRGAQIFYQADSPFSVRARACSSDFASGRKLCTSRDPSSVPP